MGIVYTTTTTKVIYRLNVYFEYGDMMEIETTVFKVGDSWVVRIPANLAEHFQIKNKSQKHFDQEKDKVKIKDISKNKAIITFPLW